MIRHVRNLFPVALALALWGWMKPDLGQNVMVGGTVITEAGPGAGAIVSLRSVGGVTTTSIYAESDGRYQFPSIASGEYELLARLPGLRSQPRRVATDGDVSAVELMLEPLDSLTAYPSAAFLSLLPDGDHKRSFLIDCTGCHQFDERIAFPQGGTRDAAAWSESITMMVNLFGPGTGFPIISNARSGSVDGEWLARNFGDSERIRRPVLERSVTARAGDAVLTEYDVPVPADLPHDLAVTRDGRVIITGMFTHQMYVLDPAAGSFSTEPIPVENANPRAVDILENGDWVVLLGQPQSIGIRRNATAAWERHAIGMYPHSIGVDGDGKIWFNGHFSYDPEYLASLDPSNGVVERYEVPTASGNAGLGESTIPYGLRVDGAGVIWATQLRGNHLIRFDPGTGALDQFEMPRTNSGPRRPDVGPDGMLWIPEYGANAIARFDPETREFTEWEFPVADALPYVIRIDQDRGTIWIGTSAGDAVGSFDPATEQFTIYQLPTRGALIRHMDVDDATGDLWAAYGASPGIPGKILRIQPTRN